MALPPMNLDYSQIQFLANEMVKSYMTGRGMSGFDNFAEEYFEMYQRAIQIISENLQKQQNSARNISL